jgi:hypothetical protein
MLKFVGREQLLFSVKSYGLEYKSYNFRCRKRVLIKRTRELQDEKDENIISNGQILSSGDAISRCRPKKKL